MGIDGAVAEQSRTSARRTFEAIPTTGRAAHSRWERYAADDRFPHGAWQAALAYVLLVASVAAPSPDLRFDGKILVMTVGPSQTSLNASPAAPPRISTAPDYHPRPPVSIEALVADSRAAVSGAAEDHRWCRERRRLLRRLCIIIERRGPACLPGALVTCWQP